MTNYDRMLQLAEEIFATQEDPTQLQVNAQVLERLARIHRNSRGERTDGDGPIAWVLVIPTTAALMGSFLSGALTEQELFEKTPEGAPYEAIYLCSVMVLEAFRGQSLAQDLVLECIHGIRADHSVSALFYWPFTSGGDALARAIARKTDLVLHARPR